MNTTKMQDLDRKYMPYLERTMYQHVWAIEYDGLNILDIADEHENMTAMEIRETIIAEGGSIDKDGTIHAGTAHYVFAETDNSSWMELDGDGKRVHDSQVYVARGARIGRDYVNQSFMVAFFESKDVREWEKQREAKGKELTAKEVRKAIENFGYYVNKEGIIKYNPKQAYHGGSSEWLEQGRKLREKAELAKLAKQK